MALNAYYFEKGKWKVYASGKNIRETAEDASFDYVSATDKVARTANGKRVATLPGIPGLANARLYIRVGSVGPKVFAITGQAAQPKPQPEPKPKPVDNTPWILILLGGAAALYLFRKRKAT